MMIPFWRAEEKRGEKARERERNHICDRTFAKVTRGVRPEAIGMKIRKQHVEALHEQRCHLETKRQQQDVRRT